MNFFDCNCFFGYHGASEYLCPENPIELLEEMKRAGIGRALVYCAGQRFGNPVDWNERLISMLKPYGALYPVWTLLPPQTEGLSAEQLMATLRENNCRAVWLFHGEHRYMLNRTTFGGVLDVLSQARVPVFVKAQLPEIAVLLKDYPNLRMIAVNQGPHSVERYLRPLMDAYPELRVEISHYLIQNALEEGVARYGAERFLFGSGFPGNPPGCAQLMLTCAGLTEEQKRKIAHGNLEALLQEVALI